MRIAGSVNGSAGVSSGHRLATEAGIEALRAGGTAVDAALAAAFTQWVVNAPQSGPGGEMVALVAEAAGGPDAGRGVQVYGGWSRAPRAAGGGRDGAAAESGGGGADPGWPPTSGPRNAVVPGSLRGAEAAWRARGRLDWATLFSGAVAAAAGHTVTPRMAEVYERVESRGHRDALRRILGSENAPRAGATIRMPDLAATLGAIAWQGPDAFYRGRLADRLVAAAEQEGAALRHDDLAAVEATVEPARRFELDDVVLWVTGAPSQAPITAALLAAAPPDADPASRDFADAVAPLTEQQLTEFLHPRPGPSGGNGGGHRARPPRPDGNRGAQPGRSAVRHRLGGRQHRSGLQQPGGHGPLGSTGPPRMQSAGRRGAAPHAQRGPCAAPARTGLDDAGYAGRRPAGAVAGPGHPALPAGGGHGRHRGRGPMVRMPRR